MRFIGLLLTVFAIISCASSENEITVYQLWCTDYNNGICEGKWIDHGYTVFKISKAWETVYYYTSSQPQYKDKPHRLSQCEILDVENWKCLDTFGHAWQMKDGQFYDSYNDGSIKNVSWFRYWSVRYLPLIKGVENDLHCIEL